MWKCKECGSKYFEIRITDGLAYGTFTRDREVVLIGKPQGFEVTEVYCEECLQHGYSIANIADWIEEEENE